MPEQASPDVLHVHEPATSVNNAGPSILPSDFLTMPAIVTDRIALRRTPVELGPMETGQLLQAILRAPTLQRIPAFPAAAALARRVQATLRRLQVSCASVIITHSSMHIACVEVCRCI